MLHLYLLPPGTKIFIRRNNESSLFDHCLLRKDLQMLTEVGAHVREHPVSWGLTIYNVMGEWSTFQHYIFIALHLNI